MEFRGLGVGQEHPRMVVELHDYDRTLDPVIKGVIGGPASYPAKEGVAKMALYLLQAHFSCLVGQVEHEMLCDVKHQLLLLCSKIRYADPFQWYNAVVPESTTEMTLVVLVPAVFRQVSVLQHSGVSHQLENLCFLLEFAWQTLHQF
jgi:hypothetical protein